MGEWQLRHALGAVWKKGILCLALHVCWEPKHNDIWLMARRQGRSKKTDTKIRCVFCNAMSNATGPDSRRHDAVRAQKGTCLVFLGDSSPLGMCSSCLEAVAMSNNVHEPSPGDRKGVGCHKRVIERLSADSMDRSAKVVSRWCFKIIETGQVRVWNGFEKHVEVERVQRPDLPDRFRFHTSALTSIPVDHTAQRTTYDMAEMVMEDYRKFGPSLTERGWFDSAPGMSNALCVHVRRVKEANQGVKAHWLVGVLLICVKREASKPASVVSRVQ